MAEFPRTNKRKINCGPCVCVTVVLVSLGVIAACILAAVASRAAYAHYTTQAYKVSGTVSSSPLGQGLAGSGGILMMTLPDSVDYYDRTYVMTDLSGAPHTFTLPVGVFFDGGFTTATFDGTEGSTFSYRRVTATRVHVISPYGVSFS